MSVHYDVAVIGAGIHGAGIAQAAAAAGYSVIVLEQYDQAAQATSSRSSKLIHGGLRYLESGQFHLVHECLHERAVLLRIAPHLVRLVPFHIPVYRETRRRPWKITLGLGLYTLFSRKPFHRIPRGRWDRLDGLRTDQLEAVFSYYDAQTDDARLTRSVLESARTLGAEVVTSARFTQAQIADDSVSVAYVAEAGDKTVSARVLVNAAGPWVNHVLSGVKTQSGASVQTHEIELVQGSHIVVDRDIAQPYYLEAPRDGRAVFVLPWKGKTMIGTTETHFQGEPADVAPQAAEIEYLLEIVNHYFNTSLVAADIIDSFAGLRVLPAGGGAAFGKSRDTFFLHDDTDCPRLMSVYGGKLTSYRASAEKLMGMIARALPAAAPVADTRTLELPVID